MKKLFSTLIIVMLVLALATSAYAMGMVGGGMNELVLGDNVAEFVVEYYEDWDEYYGAPAMFQWVATETGTLTFDFSDDDAFAAYANIYVFDLEGGQSWYGIEEKGGQVSMQVSEGYTVMMEVGCMDQLSEAGTIVFNFTMTMGEPQEPGTTEADPILVEFQWDDEYTEGTATVTVPAGKTLYFAESWGMAYGMELSVNGEFYCVLPGRNPMTWAPPVFSLTNDSAEDATYVLTLTWPLGSDYNPDQLPVNETVTLELPEGLQGGYVYKWFATADGVLTITVEGEFWTLVVNNWGEPDNWSDDIYGDNLYAVEGDENTVTMEVKTGDEIIVYVGSMDENWNAPATTLTVTVDFGGAEAGCDHANAYLEYEYHEDGFTFDIVLICPDCGEVLERYGVGEHEMNPLLLDFLFDEATNTASTTVTVPAGKTLWVGSYNIGGMLLTINGVEYGVLQGMGPWSPVVFTLTNDGTEDATYELVLSYPLGSSNNPDDMILNESFELALPENSDGYVFEWIATADGTVTLVIEGNNWVYFVNNYGDPESWDDDAYGDYFFAAYGDPNTYTFTVKAGDQVVFNFSTQDADWNFPAETLTITATFVAEGGEEGPCTHENLVHVEAVEPGCFNEGNIEHWYCEDCETVWSDEALTMITNHLSVILPATHKNIVHVEAVAPTCTENGNVEYWYCEDCLTVWIDEAMLQISNMKNVVDPATGHIYVDGQCHCGAKDELPPTGDMITIFCALVAASGMGLAILPKKKEN